MIEGRGLVRRNLLKHKTSPQKAEEEQGHKKRKKEKIEDDDDEQVVVDACCSVCRFRRVCAGETGRSCKSFGDQQKFGSSSH